MIAGYLGKVSGLLAVEAGGHHIVNHFAQYPHAFLVADSDSDPVLQYAPPLPIYIEKHSVISASLSVGLNTVQRMVITSAAEGSMDLVSKIPCFKRGPMGQP